MTIVVYQPLYANQALRTIALCYRDLDSWPPARMSFDENGDVPFDDLAKDLTLIGITGIEDPLRDGVGDAVLKCHRAGVTVKMCTGDNVLTARFIATQCGIFTKGGIIMEGPVFRKLSHTEMIEIVPRLQVLARSSPEDRKVLVETLKMIGAVGVLKTANVGFSMGIISSSAYIRAADYTSLETSYFDTELRYSLLNHLVQYSYRLKKIRARLYANYFEARVAHIVARMPLDAPTAQCYVQLLWINIIMDTFAALALATDPATGKLLERKPDKKAAPLFSVDMYKIILMQSIYQIIVILLFHFRSIVILGMEHTTHNELVIKTLVFNAFVFAQIFISINCRRLDNRLNVFEGILKNRFFIAITLIGMSLSILSALHAQSIFYIANLQAKKT
ncbi:hypothetical protein GALMADRAFT_81938 [Galerina marginata CBS 339.88]|uniref:Cation-transporting P-type ATPase C-terminal domain-containing protein n=1 Tax=Galerina marginata (strain CBS 339.88) TaxID=685588 RepID=A0A067SF50_GALM3|nr:hypothetical protein GALMADRAFT_81938 [Galerina marginata CBS 339.88]